MPLKVQAFEWKFVLSRHKSRSHLQQNCVCLSSLAISWISASYSKQFGEQADEMSDDKVSLSKGKVLDVVKIKARRSIEKCDLGSKLIFFFFKYNISRKARNKP